MIFYTMINMPEDKAKISYEDFAKLDIRIGTVVSAELVPDTDKLIKGAVNFGDLGERTIVSGIAQWKSPADLVGKQFPYVVNLEPRILRGIESAGMILAVRTKEGISLLNPDNAVEPGAHVS